VNPLVSIITPTFNSSSFILETLESVRVQCFTNYEHIIVDDASTDNTLYLINQFIKKHNLSNIRLIRLPQNVGPAVSRNAAIKIASGRFIAFLDCDDLWKSSKLSIQINYMLSNKVPFTYSSFDIINEYGAFLKSVTVPKSIDYNGLLKSQVIGCLTAVYDTSFFGKVYMPEIKRRQDFALWLKLLKQVTRAHSLSPSLCCYRISSNSLSSNKFKAVFYTWLVYRRIEKLDFYRSIYFFSFYLFNSVKRYMRFP